MKKKRISPFHKPHALLTNRQHSRRKGETPDAPAQWRECSQDVQNFLGQECWVLGRSPRRKGSGRLAMDPIAPLQGDRRAKL